MRDCSILEACTSHLCKFYITSAAVYEAAVPTFTNNFKTRRVVFSNRVLLLLDIKLSIYGEKRQKTKLICLQYANFNSITTLVLLFEIY